MKKIILFLLLISFININSKACTCADVADNFCYSINAEQFIIKVVLNDVSIDEEYNEPHRMDVTILEDINLEIPESEIIIYGSSGVDCGESLNSFYPNDTMLLAVRNHYYLPDSYYLSACGVFYLKVINDMVVGPFQPNIENITYPDFMNEIKSCLESVSIKNSLEESINIFPNPSADFISIQGAFEAADLKIIDINGIEQLSFNNKFIQNEPIDISALKAGIYFVAIKTKEQKIIRKITKF